MTDAWRIRPFDPGDYGAIVSVMNLAAPRSPTTVARVRDWDENRPARLKAGRWVVEAKDAIVAVGAFSQSPDLYHPQKFQIAIHVHPAHQGRGIGSSLFDVVTGQLQPHDPIGYQGRAYADDERALRFLVQRGFQEDFRTWESVLDVERFDPSPWQGLEEQLRAQGIQIRSLAEIGDDPGRDRQIFELERDTMRDIPSPPSVTSHREDLTPEQIEERFARYVERALHHPDRPPESFFVARRGGEYIGLSYFELDREHRIAEILMTGVTREYRGRGVGTALKVRGVRYACDHGYRTIITGNDTLNRPILAINDRLGFVRQPQLIFFEKSLERPVEATTDNA